MKKKSKKDKGKPRLPMLLKEAILKEMVFQTYDAELDERTLKYNTTHDTKLNFDLAQNGTNKKDFINQALNISYFYDKNFTGNKDFMHTPNFTQVATNFVKYPIMLATKTCEDGSKDIVGATTIKYQRNQTLSDNPYFPTKGENVLMITGVLSRDNNLVEEKDKVYGVGKELYKTSIKGAIAINRINKVRLVCEIDCRNINSLNSIKKAIKELNDEGIKVGAYLRGYYEIVNDNRKIVEAPTFMVEFNLDNREIDSEKTIFSYVDCRAKRLYPDLDKVIKSNTDEIMQFITLDKDAVVVYHEIDEIDINDIELAVGTSAEGNDRVPVYNPVVLRTLENNL